MSLGKHLDQVLQTKLMSAYHKVFQEVQEEFIEKAVEEFRRRMGKEMARWALSTTSQINMAASGVEIVVTLRVPNALIESGDKMSVVDAVIGKILP